MTTSAAPPPPVPAPAPEGLVLRSSAELRVAPADANAPAPARQPGDHATGRSPSAPREPLGGAEQAALATASEPWLLVGLAALASAGWLLERRRRRRLETEKDSVLWADVQPPNSSIITSLGELTDMLPPSEHAGLAPTLTAPAFGEPTSRREATLIDLHQLDGKLRRRRTRGDLLGAVALLQQHLADFRYTSPWVFLELRELHHILAREQEWEVAREAFRDRFAQKAPLWQAPSTADAQLANDTDICGELVAQWPYREARMVVLRWMLGEAESRHTGYRPPVLALGVYRDLMFVDRVLDLMMITRPLPADSLL
jgi:hypothetical protein